jgi:hypothetical protein
MVCGHCFYKMCDQCTGLLKSETTPCACWQRHHVERRAPPSTGSQYDQITASLRRQYDALDKQEWV